MIKKLIKFIIFLIIIVIIIITYLSFFGINTKKFNQKIKEEVLKVNKNINLELKTVKILVNPINLSIDIKTLEPILIINNNKLNLKQVYTSIAIKSFINKEFSIESLQISTKAIKLNNLVLLARSFKNSTELFILDNIINDGFLVGDINLNFDSSGKIKNDYEIKGFVKKGKLNILRKYSIEDLNFYFNIIDNDYQLEKIKANFNKIKFSSPSIKIKEKDNQFLINGKLISKKYDLNTKLLKNLFGESFKDYGVKDIIFASDNTFNFALNKKFKVSNFNLKSIVNLNELVYRNNFLEIKKYLPSFKNLIKLQDHKILINYKKNELKFVGEGKILIEDKIDKLEYKIIKKNKKYFFDTSIYINKNPLLIDILQYKKKKDLDSMLKLSGVYKKNNQVKFDSISFKESDNIFLIKSLNLNSDFDILNVKSLKLNFVNNNKIKNQISLKKNKDKYEIYGKVFDASELINELLIVKNEEESSSIFNDLNSSFNLEIEKTFLDKDTFTNNIKGKIDFKNNKIYKLNLNSTFPNSKKLILTIVTNKKKERITTLFTDYPKPLVKKYKFIKGFEEGSLDYYSIEKNGVSNSLLTIDNFKIKEVPVFAKLLSLASLQGIGDLLTGEGIRFTDFEMKFSNKNGLITIEEIYSIGPAVSILMDGYIEKIVSLRGTLVPATTINKTIASIPLIGNILVGKKAGEGVFGVSFKIKGPPGDLKTSVNPIKTLTPRFITRTLEKIKKN
tara:strand:- start:28 stop:2226 length:2199 start_codon:yes stop_codon:yes gene_type:complete